MNNLLLDTCTVIWTGIGVKIDKNAVAQINSSYREGRRVFVSLISAWEIGLLVSNGRLRLERSAIDWFEDYLKNGQIAVADLTARVLIDSSNLPECPLVDPADRMIVATARAFNLSIVTRDRLILDYATEGYVRAIRC